MMIHLFRSATPPSSRKPVWSIFSTVKTSITRKGWETVKKCLQNINNQTVVGLSIDDTTSARRRLLSDAKPVFTIVKNTHHLSMGTDGKMNVYRTLMGNQGQLIKWYIDNTSSAGRRFSLLVYFYLRKNWWKLLWNTKRKPWVYVLMITSTWIMLYLWLSSDKNWIRRKNSEKLWYG